MNLANNYSGIALGNYVREMRKRRGMNGRKLALAAQVDPTWLSRLERGLYQKPSMQSLERVATALGIAVADLYAAAGYKGSKKLPGFGHYLRAKFDLPEEAINQLEAHLELINDHYAREKGIS